MDSLISNKLQKYHELSKKLETRIFSTLLFSFKKDEALEVITNLKVQDFQFFREAYNCVVMAVERDEALLTLFMNQNVPVAQFLENQSALSSLDFSKSIKELKRISATLNYIENSQEFIDKVDYLHLDEHVSELAGKLYRHNFGTKEAVDAKAGVRAFESMQEVYAKKFKDGQKYLGTPTGFETIDEKTEGIIKNYLYILGGYSGIGKTTLALNIAENFLKMNKKVVIFSLEMSAEDVMAKMIGTLAGINSIKILKGYLTPEESQKVEEAKCLYYDFNIKIYDNLINFEQIKLAIIQENMKGQIDLCIIDYLQMMGSNNHRTEYERMSAFPSELKVEICRKLEIPVIALSQVSNEDAKMQNDVVSGFKGSGGIEAAADLAMKLIYDEKREERDLKKQQGLCVNVSLALLKQRFGASGGMPMSFDGKTGRFYEGHDINLKKYL